MILRIIITFLFFNFSVFASDLKDHVTEGTLKNGLKYYIVHNELNPNIFNATVVVNAGGRDGKPGIAHFLEHCLFLGSKKYSKEEVLKVEKIYGSRSNAMTSNKQTRYFFEGLANDKNDIEIFLDILSDRVKNPLFPGDLVEVEKKPVADESVKCIPNKVREYSMQVVQFLFPNQCKFHPQGITGTPQQVGELTKNDLIEFLKEFYVPNNMAVIVESGLPGKDILTLIEKYFSDAHFDEKFVHKRVKNILDYPKKPEIMTFEDELITNPTVSLYFPVRASDNKKWLKLGLSKLLCFLDSSYSSELGFVSLLRDKKLEAQSVSCKYLIQGECCYFVIEATPNDYSLKALESLEKSIKKIHSESLGTKIPEKTILMLNKSFVNFKLQSGYSFGELSNDCRLAFRKGKLYQDIDDTQDYLNLTSDHLYEIQNLISKEQILTVFNIPKNFKEEK